jgi:hypothetical protein
MMIPMHDRNSKELLAWLATALNFWVLYFQPPNRKQQPAVGPSLECSDAEILT